MIIKCFKDKMALAAVAAQEAATILRDTIQAKGTARLVAATGAAQFEFLEILTSLPGIDWSRVEMFHLDEYIGLPIPSRELLSISTREVDKQNRHYEPPSARR